MWPKGKSIEDAVVISEEEGGLYKLKGHLETTLVHETTNPSELWHRRLSHINYKALPHVNKVVTGLPDLNINHEGICKGCAKGKNIKNPFPKSETKTKGTLELILHLLMNIQEGHGYTSQTMMCLRNSRN